MIKSRSKDLTLPKQRLIPAVDPQGNEPIAAAKGYLKYAIIGGIVLTLFLVILMIVGVIRRRRKEDELEVDVDEEMVTFTTTVRS